MKCRMIAALISLSLDAALTLGAVHAAGASGQQAGTVSPQVSAGDNHTCRLESDGTVDCWGDNFNGQVAPPAGLFTQISAGHIHTCGVNTDGTLACWGDNFYGEASPPEGLFTQVSAGYAHTCGIKIDGTLACWGDNITGESVPPAGLFTEVSAGYFHSCGVKSDGTVACWGYNNYGQSAPPAGVFTQVSAGGNHTCGVRNDRTVACWGEKGLGASTPPAGLFTQVSAGAGHACGVKNDGTLTCWGFNTSGQATPPAGVFSQVSAGGNHSCGVKNDGTVACWGNNNYGQITVPEMLAKVWIGLRNSDDIGLRVDLLAEVFIKVGTTETRVGAGQLDNQSSGSSGFAGAILRSVTLGLTEGSGPVPDGAQVQFVLSMRRTCFGGGHSSGTVRLWYNGATVDNGTRRDAGSRFNLTIGGATTDYLLRSGSTLSPMAGTLRMFIDKAVTSSAPCPDRPFTPFSTWSLTLP